MKIPVVTREGAYVIRGGYSTAISTRYSAYAGYDNHGQHTLVMYIEYCTKHHETKNDL